MFIHNDFSGIEKHVKILLNLKSRLVRYKHFCNLVKTPEHFPVEGTIIICI